MPPFLLAFVALGLGEAYSYIESKIVTCERDAGCAEGGPLVYYIKSRVELSSNKRTITCQTCQGLCGAYSSKVATVTIPTGAQVLDVFSFATCEAGNNIQSGEACIAEYEWRNQIGPFCYKSSGLLLVSYETTTLPSCSSPMPMNAPECEGGKGLSLTGNEMQIGQKIFEIFGNSPPYSTRTPTPSSSINETNETSTRPDGSKCSFSNDDTSSDVYDYIICPLGAKSSSSSSEKSSSSSSDESSSSSSEEPSSSSSWEASSSSSDESDQCLAYSMRPLQKSADGYDDGWVYMGRQAYKTITERQYFPAYPDRYFDASGRIYSGNKPHDKHYYYIDGNKIYKPRTVETYLEFGAWRKDEVDIIGNQISFFSFRKCFRKFFY
jgi:hypothetical protein